MFFVPRRRQKDTDGRDRRREGEKEVAMRLEGKKTNETGRGRRNSLKNDTRIAHNKASRTFPHFFFPLLHPFSLTYAITMSSRLSIAMNTSRALHGLSRRIWTANFFPEYS